MDSPFNNQYNTMYKNRLDLISLQLRIAIQSKVEYLSIPYNRTIKRQMRNNRHNLYFIRSQTINIRRSVKHGKGSTYFSKEVKYFGEDPSGRLEIEFYDVERIYKDYFVLCSGMVLGFLGSETRKGKFLVKGICFPGYSNGLPECNPKWDIDKRMDQKKHLQSVLLAHRKYQRKT